MVDRSPVRSEVIAMSAPLCETCRRALAAIGYEPWTHPGAYVWSPKGMRHLPEWSSCERTMCGRDCTQDGWMWAL